MGNNQNGQFSFAEKETYSNNEHSKSEKLHKNEFELHCDSVLDFFRSVDNIFRQLPKGCRGSVNNKA